MVLTDSLQHKFINNLITNQIFASVYLKNGIRLKGHIIAHDEMSVFLEAAQLQLIYKHAISTVSTEISFSRVE